MIHPPIIAPGQKFANGDCLIEQLSSGRYASVWLAKTSDEHPCVYKIANIPELESNAVEARPLDVRNSVAFMRTTGSLLSVKVDARELLRREFEFLRAAQGLGVVAAHELLEFDGLLCLKRDYIDAAHTLRDEINTGAASLQDIQSLLVTTACLAQFGLTHGDLKPENVLVGNGQLWLVDAGYFGELSTADGGVEEVVYTTPGYYPWLKPNDLWAIGAILWEIVIGRHPLEPVELSAGSRENAPRLTEELEFCLKASRSAGPDFLEPLRWLAVPPGLANKSNSAEILDILLRGLSLRLNDGRLDLAEPYADSLEFQLAVQRLRRLLEDS